MGDETHVPEETSDDLMRRGDFENRHPRDIAEGMRDIPVAKIEDVLRALPKAKAAQVLSELPKDIQVRLFESIPIAHLCDIVGEMFSDDAADVLGHIPAAKLREIMRGMSAPEAKQINDLLQYPEDTAGGIMQTEVIAVSGGSHDRGGHRNASTRRRKIYLMAFSISTWSMQNTGCVAFFACVIFFSVPPIARSATSWCPRCGQFRCTPTRRRSRVLFRAYGFSAMPVVDDFQRLRGVVTADDVFDIVEEEATEDMQRMVGLLRRRVRRNSLEAFRAQSPAVALL